MPTCMKMRRLRMRSMEVKVSVSLWGCASSLSRYDDVFLIRLQSS